MKRGQKAAWFLSGVLVTVLAMAAATPALANVTRRDITIEEGVRVYMNDRELHPVDINESPVPVFGYNGTTYLPIRAISSALDVPVMWDQESQSVYIGRHTGEKPSLWLKDMDYFIGSDELDISESEIDNQGNTYGDVITNVSLDNTYVLKGQYTALSGTLFLRQWAKDSTRESKLWIYGDSKLLYEGTVSGGVAPMDFRVDVTGVQRLNIRFNCAYTAFQGGEAAIADLGLWTS